MLRMSPSSQDRSLFHYVVVIQIWLLISSSPLHSLLASIVLLLMPPTISCTNIFYRGDQQNLLLASLRDGQAGGLEKEPAVTGELVESWSCCWLLLTTQLALLLVPPLLMPPAADTDIGAHPADRFHMTIICNSLPNIDWLTPWQRIFCQHLIVIPLIRDSLLSWHMAANWL